MATSAKYQRAPQEDPEDYTNAPPAYGEPSTSRNDETQGLFAGGAPRSSEDNIPDDFKVGRDIQRAVLRQAPVAWLGHHLGFLMIQATIQMLTFYAI
jgi:FtsH-binding integral membrane protein